MKIRSLGLAAALLIAASATLIYLIAIGFVSRPAALVLASAYAFGSCVWAISSQQLWQQTPEIFFLTLGVFFLFRVPQSWIRGAGTGFALSAAAACRPTAALVAAVAMGWLLFSDRKALAAFVPAATPSWAETECRKAFTGRQVRQQIPGCTDVAWVWCFIQAPSRFMLVIATR